MFFLQHNRSFELYWEFLTHGKTEESAFVKMSLEFQQQLTLSGGDKSIETFKVEENNEAILQLK